MNRCGFLRAVRMCGGVGWGATTDTSMRTSCYHRFMHTWYYIPACPDNIHCTAAPNNNAPTPGYDARPNPRTKNVARVAGPGLRKRAMCPFSDSIWQPAFGPDCTASSCQKMYVIGAVSTYTQGD